MRENYGITREAMEASVDGLVRRQILGQTAVGLICQILRRMGSFRQILKHPLNLVRLKNRAMGGSIV